jgi:uncharacterized protein HemY
MVPTGMAKLLIVIGLAIAAAGVALWLGVPIGRLPGDVVIRRGAYSFYFPLTTSVLASVVLTVLFALLRR